MPEGDTIYTTAVVLQRALGGQVVTRFESVYPQLVRVDREQPIAGRRVERVSAVGKHLLVHFSGDLILRTHMRMNGSWHLYGRADRWRRGAWRARIVLEAGERVAVAFDVPEAEFLTARTAARSPVAALGPDLLAPDFDEEEAMRRLASDPAREVGQALLDQRAMAGVGNVFKSEILFLRGIHPFVRVGALSGEQLRGLVRTSRELLRRNVTVPEPGVPRRRGRTTTRTLDPTVRLWVYGRGGEPCRRCATPIAWQRQGVQGRSSYWCPRCQPSPRHTPAELGP